MTVGRTPRFGHRTLYELSVYIDKSRTWTEIRAFLLKHGLHARFAGSSKLEATLNVFQPMQTTENNEELVGTQEALEEITTHMYTRIRELRQKQDSAWGFSQASLDQAEAEYLEWRSTLRRDGYDLHEGKVVPFPAAAVDISREEGTLERRLKGLGFQTSSKHLEQALDNVSRRNWEAANGQIRAFLESICDEIVKRTANSVGTPPTGGEARKYLESSGFLTQTEGQLLQSFFKLLHTLGSHPGTSSEDDCHRRLLMAVALANYYLEKFIAQTGTTIK